jgi:type 1 fimbria pilin
MNRRFSRLGRISRAASLFAALTPFCSHAGSPSPNMHFSGYLLTPPPCTVSSQGGRIEVVFEQTLNISKINGDNYKQTVPYQIDCPGMNRPGVSWKMRLTVVGTHTDFDNAAVQTSVADLGIKLTLNNTDFTLNIPRDITLDSEQSPPKLEAAPVKLTGARLPLQDFKASALLIAELY